MFLLCLDVKCVSAPIAGNQADKQIKEWGRSAAEAATGSSEVKQLTSSLGGPLAASRSVIKAPSAPRGEKETPTNSFASGFAPRQWWPVN
jgi:hypothetical protein